MKATQAGKNNLHEVFLIKKSLKDFGFCSFFFDVSAGGYVIRSFAAGASIVLALRDVLIA
jgi:hypothetical protein